MAHVAIGPLVRWQRGHEHRAAIFILESHARAEIAGMRAHLQDPPGRTVVHGHERLCRPPNRNFPEAALETLRLGQTSSETRIILACGVLLVVTPEHAGDAPERFFCCGECHLAGGCEQFSRSHCPSRLDPTMVIGLHSVWRCGAPREIWPGNLHFLWASYP